jgi:hypothetical protein
MKKYYAPYFSIFMGLLLLAGQSRGQFTLSGQIRTRTEYRDGAGTLRLKTSQPAFFTSQRTRLVVDYTSDRLLFHTAVQDVRVWGQDASTINNADGARLGLHEGWAEIILSNKKDTSFASPALDYFSVKAGRQDIIYDDSRLLGNLDWLQQARHHDAIIFKLSEKGWQADLGFAFNQNTDAFNYNGTYYTPANVQPFVKDNKGILVPAPAGFIPLTTGGSLSGNSSATGSPALQSAPGTNGQNQDYKAFQYLYTAKKIGATKISALFFSDQFGKYILDSLSTSGEGKIYGRRFNQEGTNARYTAGAQITGSLDKKKQWGANAGYYYQWGKDRDAQELNAFMSTVSLTYTHHKMTYAGGWDYLSGNDAFSVSGTSHRFDPLYGTPHKFWGYMDYFYAGTGAPASGLSDAYAKAKYTSAGNRFNVGLDYHFFSLAEDQKDPSGKATGKNLGSELDLVAGYALNKFAAIEWGLSYMAATDNMAYAKGATPSAVRMNPVWSYVSLNIKPVLFSK